MIDLFNHHGQLFDSTSLTRIIQLTGQEQSALSQAIINGKAVMRLQFGQFQGAPSVTLNKIYCAWYNQYAEPTDAEEGLIWCDCQTLTQVCNGEKVEYTGTVITAAQLACYPDFIKFTWTIGSLDTNNFWWDAAIGIMLASSRV